MGESITQDDIAAEIAEYLEAEYPDYAVQDGKMEMLLDRSRQAWWRRKV